MKRCIAVFIVLVMLAGCASADNKKQDEDLHKIKIVTTIFPIYDFAREIAADKAYVKMLLPPGVEVHSFEPTARDVIEIREADIFIYTGDELEPWVAKLVSELGDSPLVVDVSLKIDLIDHHHDEDHDEDHDDKDPHFWLDPLLAARMVEAIASALKNSDKINADLFELNSRALIDELHKLHEEISETMTKVKRRVIIYGGHFAFGYFAKRYDLEHISPYKGFSPDAEPTPKRLAEIIDTLKETDSGYIFFEELIDPRVAKIISDETGARMLLLHGIHNLSKDEMQEGRTYISLMRQNLENLKTGLGYE